MKMAQILSLFFRALCKSLACVKLLSAQAALLGLLLGLLSGRLLGCQGWCCRLSRLANRA